MKVATKVTIFAVIGLPLVVLGRAYLGVSGELTVNDFLLRTIYFLLGACAGEALRKK